MKFLKIFSLILLVAMFATSCDKELDINTNPLVATTADPNAVLPFVFVQYSNRHTSELGTRMMDVPQHIGACFNSPRAGATGSTITGNTWGMYYTQVLGNLELVETDALAAGATSNNIAAIAKIFKAKAFFELSSIWGDIPFTQALDGVRFPTPEFDNQETVFRGVVTILDEAIALIDAMPAEVADVSVGDLIYNGNMDNWRRWANSLKLRVLMMIRNKDTSVDTEISKVLSEPMIEENSQAALIRYADNSGEANSWQRLITNFFGGRNETAGVYSPSAVSFDLFNQNDDPRFGLMISDPDGMGPADIGQATFGTPGATAHVSNEVVRNDMPHNMFLPSEISFYRAELALLGVSSDDAQAEFEKGLRQICKYWGGDIPGADPTLAITDAAIDNFISNIGTVDLQKVHEQLYLESFFRPVVAWNTVRRTKVPDMLPVPGSSISSILKRFNYAPDEVSSNPNTPANVPTDTPMWFEN